MKTFPSKAIVQVTLGLLLTGMLLITGCDNFRRIEPRPAPTTPTTPAPPGKQPVQDFVVTYNYNNTDKVQLSANDIVLQVGQRLILQPAPGLTGETRFTSSGEYFFGDIMQPVANQPSGKAVFTAIKPGKGRLQIIPNGTETGRASNLLVTVQ